MKILVTGGAGFIGSNLAIELESKNHEVMVLDNFIFGNYRNLLEFNGRVITGSICDSNLLNSIKDVDFVFHQGAISDTTYKDESETLKVNIQGFNNILNYCKENQIGLVYASSAAVYGKQNGMMIESQQASPANAYAFSKLQNDISAKKQYEYFEDTPLIGLRYFNVYGSGEVFKNKSASMIYQLTNQIKANNKGKLFKNGEQKRDFVYIKDIISANLLAMKSKKHDVYNVGSGQANSFNEVFNLINKELNTNATIEYIDNPYSDFYQSYTQANLSKISSELNYSPKFDINSGIHDYLSNL